MTRRPPLVRRLVPVAMALVLSAPVLASCGFDYATNRVNTISMGINDRSGDVDVIGAVVVSSQPGSGTFVSTLVNNDASEAVSLDSAAGDADSTLTVEDFDPVEIAPRGRVTLPPDGQVTLTGDFSPGDFLTLQLTFSTGEQTSFELPVVPGCRQWEGLDSSEEALALEPEAANPGNREDDATDDVPETELAAYDCEPETSDGE